MLPKQINQPVQMDSKNLIKCLYCDKAFIRKGDCHNHLRKKHSNMPYHTCKVCLLMFENEEVLENHIEKQKHCNECPKKFCEKSKLRDHVQKHLRSFTCDYCGKLFSYSRRNNFIEHIRIHSGEKPFHCNECTKSFRSISNLCQHKRKHDSKIHACLYCEKSYMLRGTLFAHLRKVHSSEKYCKCSDCRRIFKNEEMLKKHVEKKQICDVCEKKFCEKSIFDSHLQQHFNSFICDYCGKSRSKKSNFIRHVRTHLKEKTFSCDVCQKLFCYRSDLIRHKQKHKKIPRKCIYCEISFTHRENLFSHIRNVHPTKKCYKCLDCNNIFESRRMLKEHVQKKINRNVCEKSAK